MSSSPIKAVLFDMDDTLVDWSGFNTQWMEIDRRHMQFVYDFLVDAGCTLEASFEHLLTTYRENVMEGWATGRSNLRAPHMGMIMQTTLEGLGIIFNEHITIESLLTAYNWQGADGVEVFPDVPDALQKLIDMGIKIGILTNAFQPMWVRDAELKRFDLLKYFPDQACRMSAADLGYLKPHQKVFEKAMANLGTKPDETIYVGDNLVADIAGAQGAGMRAVLRVNHPTPPLMNGLVIPDATISALDDLLPMVEDWDTHA
jgi:HAD superfamily hydrolase (TIGR01662 family)